MAPQESRQRRTNEICDKSNQNHHSGLVSREKNPPSVFWTAWVAVLGFGLLFLNTHMSRATFRSLIESQTMHDGYYSSVHSAQNTTKSGNGGKDNEAGAPLGIPNVLNDRNTNQRSVAIVLQNVHDTGNSSDAGDHDLAATGHLSNDSDSPFGNHVVTNHHKTPADSINGKNTVVANSQTNDLSANLTSRWTNAVTVDDGNLQIETFDRGRQRNGGMAACLINLEDTIRMAEWLPYHYATLPLGSLVIALDPNNSERGIQRTLELIDLWKDKIEITLWPEFFLPEKKKLRKRQSYVRERQVYFANQCLAYHREQNRTWTLLTDNDEYIIFNYVHDDESLKFDHPGANQKKVQKEIKYNRKTYMPLRKDLPAQNQSTILEFIHQHDKVMQNNKSSTPRFWPTCVRLPGIHYGGYLDVNDTLVGHEIIEPRFLSTLRYIHHEKRQSKFSKVMIDVSKISAKDVEWSEKNHAITIHNPSRVCGYNGNGDSGADYPSSLFRLNHYYGSPESYMERAGDYRKRSLDVYKKKSGKVKPSESNWDSDISSWVDVFVRSVGGATEAKKFFEPLVAYQEIAQTV